MSYKRNVDDLRESPFFTLREQLLNKGADISVYDSWATSENTVSSLQACLDKARALVIVTEHSDIIEELNKLDISACGIEVVVDGRNCLDGDSIRALGILYSGIGRRG